MLKFNDNNQLCFDFENVFYGLFSRDGEFHRIPYSGLSFRLLDRYSTYQEAENERKLYTNADYYEVKEIPSDLILDDDIEYKRRVEGFKC